MTIIKTTQIPATAKNKMRLLSLILKSGSKKLQNPAGVDSGTHDPWPPLLLEQICHEPRIHLLEQICNEPCIHLLEQICNEPCTHLLEQICYEPRIHLLEQIFNESRIHLLEQICNQPRIHLLEQICNEPRIHLLEQICHEPRIHLLEQICNEPCIHLLEQICNEPRIHFVKLLWSHACSCIFEINSNTWRSVAGLVPISFMRRKPVAKLFVCIPIYSLFRVHCAVRYLSNATLSGLLSWTGLVGKGK